MQHHAYSHHPQMGPFSYTHPAQHHQQQHYHHPQQHHPAPQHQVAVEQDDEDDDDSPGLNTPSGPSKTGNRGGRPKDHAWEFFTGDRDRASCKSCGWACDRPKAFRMRDHILRDCTQISEADRDRLRSHQANKEANAAANKESGNKAAKKRKRELDLVEPTHTAGPSVATRPMAHKRGISCHVLDSTSGKPGTDMEIRLDRLTASGFVLIGSSQTNADGRCSQLIPPSVQLEVGIYKMTFFTSKYFSARGIASFYPFVEVTFEVKEAESSYHIPLLLSPYSYTTYRGS